MLVWTSYQQTLGDIAYGQIREHPLNNLIIRVFHDIQRGAIGVDGAHTKSL